jgi:hypothetical protein
MIDHSTIEYIKELENEDKDIFYNGVGDPLFYKMGIKHIGFSNLLGLTKKMPENNNNYKVLVDDLYVCKQSDSVIVHYKKGDIFSVIDLKQE